MTYQEASDYLSRFHNNEKGFKAYTPQDYDPNKVGKMLTAAKLDYSDIKIVHIAGTKGKGSTAVYAARMLELSGFKTGIYTSPHIFKLNERIRINSDEITDSEFSALVDEFQNMLPGFGPTYFDALTFLAMVYYIRAKCDWIVLETGLGGRLDSTNFCDPAVSIITSLGYDHMALLGDTIEKIAAEKSGIIKPGKPVITAPQAKEILEVIRSIAEQGESEFYVLDTWVSWEINERNSLGCTWSASPLQNTHQKKLLNVRSAQIGDIFVQNILLAIGGLMAAGFTPSEEVIREAAATKIPYRMSYEQTASGPVLIDVGHTDESFRQLFLTLQKYFPDRIVSLYIGVLADKEIGRLSRVIRQYLTLFQKITIFDFHASRPCGGTMLLETLKDLPIVTYCKSVDQLQFDRKSLPVITGSFYAVEPILKVLNQEFPE